MDVQRTTGGAAIGLGVVYVIVAVLFLLLPEGQQASGGGELLASLSEDGAGLYATQQWFFVASGLLGFAVVAGLHVRLRDGHAGSVTWATAVGYLGFAVTIMEGLRAVSWAYDAPELLRSAGEQTRLIIGGDFAAGSLDPTGFLGFGAVGTWVLVLCLVALAEDRLPRGAAGVGVLVAVAYWLVAVGTLADVEVLITIAAVAAIVVAPVFYVWVGRELRGTAPPRTAAV